MVHDPGEHLELTGPSATAPTFRVATVLRRVLTHAEGPSRKYHGNMNGRRGFSVLIARLAGLRATARSGAFHWTPEAERMRSALEMHDLGVKLYQQRMRREHPDVGRSEIEGLVRSWLTAPRPTRDCACRQESAVVTP